jgi:hypothetical protein
MLLNPDAFVQAEIDRRLELAGAFQWHRPLPVTRKRHIIGVFTGRSGVFRRLPTTGVPVR